MLPVLAAAVASTTVLLLVRTATPERHQQADENSIPKIDNHLDYDGGSEQRATHGRARLTNLDETSCGVS